MELKLQPDRLANNRKFMFGTPIHSRSYAASKDNNLKALDAYLLANLSGKG